MSDQTLLDLLRPIIQQLNPTERETLKAHILKIKHWADLARRAHHHAKTSATHDTRTRYEGFQESFMSDVATLNTWLSTKTPIQLIPKNLWPNEVPFNPQLEVGKRMGSAVGFQIKIERRAKGTKEPALNISKVLARVKEAEEKMGISPKPRGRMILNPKKTTPKRPGNRKGKK